MCVCRVHDSTEENINNISQQTTPAKNRPEKVRKRERERDGEKQEGFGNSYFSSSYFFFPPRKSSANGPLFLKLASGKKTKTGRSVFLSVAIKYASDTHIKALSVLHCTSD